MYCCLIRIAFLYQWLKIKDEQFLYCWETLQQLMQEGNFIVGAVKGNYCIFYHRNPDFQNHRMVMQTLRLVTEHLTQNEKNMDGYRMMFSVSDHQDVQQEFMTLRTALRYKTEDNCLWFTESAMSVFSAYARFWPSGSHFLYRGTTQNSAYSLFTQFVAAPTQMEMVRSAIQALPLDTDQHRLLLFRADIYSGVGELVRRVVEPATDDDIPCIYLPKLNGIDITESFLVFLSNLDTTFLRGNTVHAEEDSYNDVLAHVSRITNNRNAAMPAMLRNDIRDVFCTLLRLYIIRKQSANITPYIFIDDVDFWTTEDLAFLDSILARGDPEKTIILIGVAASDTQLNTVEWHTVVCKLTLDQYDDAVIKQKYANIQQEVFVELRKERPVAFVAFSHFLMHALSRQDSAESILLRVLLPIHREILYIIRKSITCRINVENLIDMFSGQDYKANEIYDAVIFLVMHGYLRDVKTLYPSRCVEELFLNGLLKESLSSKPSALERIISNYFITLHERNEIVLPPTFLHDYFSVVSFERWVKNMYLHCERMQAVGNNESYLDTVAFMDRIKHLKKGKQEEVRPAILVLRARECLYTRRIVTLLECITLLREIQTIPDYLQIPWLDIQAEYSIITGGTPTPYAKSILTRKKMRYMLSTAYCILGIQARYKNHIKESSHYFHFALEYIQPQLALHACMFAFSATCCHNFCLGKFSDFRIYVQQALSCSKQYGNYVWHCYYLIISGRLEFEIGYYKKAGAIFEQAGNIAEYWGNNVILQICRCWEARTIGYAGNWDGAYKILRQSASSLERNFFLSEAHYFMQDYNAALKLLYEAQAMQECFPEYSTMFCLPEQWKSSWDALEHLFVKAPEEGLPAKRILQSFTALVLCAIGEAQDALALAEEVIEEVRQITSDPNLSFYLQIGVEVIIELDKSRNQKGSEYINILSQAVRNINERSSNIENRFERQDFFSHNYWNNRLVAYARDVNITN